MNDNMTQQLRVTAQPAVGRVERLAVLLLVTAMQAVIQPVAAQVKPDEPRTVVPRDTANPGRHKTLFTYRDAALAAGFVGLTFAMFPVDKHIAESLQDPDLANNRFLENSATGFEVITTPGAFIIGGSLYVFGRAAHHPDVTDLGWHGTEAVLISSGLTGFLKGALGRARPFVTNDTNPRDFKFGKGFSSADRQSFPSGHTTTAFAAASAVTSEMRRLYPKSVWYVAPVMYGGATMVGVSRMYHNKHWASDVVLGAAVGTFSGIKVVRYSHAHPDNKVDQLILHATIMPDGHGGGYLGFTLPAP